MKKLLLLFLLLPLAACAVVQKRVETLPWPTRVSSVQGEGDLEGVWRKERFSGPFTVRMEYPDLLFLEVYGPFGQTVVYVQKEAGRFLLVAGQEKTSDETVFEKRYGFRLGQFMSDLAMKGERYQTADGWVTDHGNYRVRYGQDRRGRRKMCWESSEGSICLTFDEISFV